MRSRIAGTSSGFKIRPAVQPVPVPVGFHALSTVPTGVYQTTNRLGGVNVWARAPLGRIASRKGRPTAKPVAVRNRVRRLIGFTAKLLAGWSGDRGRPVSG